MRVEHAWNVIKPQIDLNIFHSTTQTVGPERCAPEINDTDRCKYGKYVRVSYSIEKVNVIATLQVCCLWHVGLRCVEHHQDMGGDFTFESRQSSQDVTPETETAPQQGIVPMRKESQASPGWIILRFIVQKIVLHQSAVRRDILLSSLCSTSSRTLRSAIWIDGSWCSKSTLDSTSYQWNPMDLSKVVKTRSKKGHTNHKKTLTSAANGSSPLQGKCCQTQVTLQEGHRLQVARHFSSRPTLVLFST